MKLPLSKIAEFISRRQGDFPREECCAGLFHRLAHDSARTNFSSRSKASGSTATTMLARPWKREPLPRSSGKTNCIAIPDKTRLLAVDDTLVALQTLATAVRKLWGKPLVGVTGSAGKTTTKEAIAHVLASRFRVLKSEGNFNNHFGLPLMLLKLEPEHDVAVIEMGMSHAGEIRALAKIAQPEIGVVTNVAPVHLEFFDSLAGIARAKYELIESLPASGTAVLNADDEYVSQFGRDFKGKVITYGTRADRRRAGRECADPRRGGLRVRRRDRPAGASTRVCRWSASTTF